MWNIREQTLSFPGKAHTLQVQGFRAELAGCQGRLEQQQSGWCLGNKGLSLVGEGLRDKRKDLIFRDGSKYGRILAAGYGS